MITLEKNFDHCHSSSRKEHFVLTFIRLGDIHFTMDFASVEIKILSQYSFLF